MSLTDKIRDSMFAADSPQEFNALLRDHGPITDSELPLIAKRARSWRGRVRRNAAWMLLLGHSPARDPYVQALARETEDAGVFALVAADQPDSEALARAHQDMVTTSLDDPDARVAAAALRLAWKIELPGLNERMRTKLSDKNLNVRQSALELLAESGPGTLEPELKAMLSDPKVRRGVSLTGLFEALLHSDDPALADVFASAMVGAEVGDAVSLTTAMAHVTPHPPWVRTFLLAQARAEGVWRWSAFEVLSKDPNPPLADLVAIARDHLTKEIASGTPESTLRLHEGVEACGIFLSHQLGCKCASTREALEFTQQWKPPAGKH